MNADNDHPRTAHLLALAGLSAAVLAFEVLLLRLFEFSHWHHFAGLAIALALLGLGAAGTVLALAGERVLRLGDRWFLGNALAATAAFLGVLYLQSRIAVRPLFAAWDAGELLRLLAVDLAAFLPFFCAGLAIGQVFPRWPRYPGRLYGANLLGSAAGSLGASGLLMVVQVETALAVVAAALAGLATTLALAAARLGFSLAALTLLLLATACIVAPPAPAVSDFKALARVLDLPDAEVLSIRPGLQGRLTLVRSDSLRSAPGLGLRWQQPVPPSDAVIIGSDRLLPLPRRFDDPPEHARASLAGLPLALRPAGAVAVLGSSAWSTPALAPHRPLAWIEPDRRLLALAAGRGAADTMRLVAESPARFLADEGQAFALITLDGVFAEGDAASEDYLMTVEGLARALERLHADGLLALPLTLDYPPRRGPRALTTVAAALAHIGVPDPGNHVASLRAQQALLILASPRPLARDDQEAIVAFADRWQFDRVWLPGMGAGEANRHHVLDTPVFFESARAAFTDAAMPAEARWFETEPPTLDRPYFQRAMRWSRVPELLDNLGRRALGHLDWTLVMTALGAAIVTLLAAVLILAPLGRMPPVREPLARRTLGLYFAALGIGYMFFEMALFQRAILFLGEPVLAASVVFAVFMAGSGLGALKTPAEASLPALSRIFGMIVLGGVVAVAALWLTDELLTVDIAGLRVALVGAAMLPLAWALGRPLPWALRQLASQPRWLPWAWGLNGFASVLGISLAPLVSVHHGQSATLAAAALCYVVAWLVVRRWCENTALRVARARN